MKKHISLLVALLLLSAFITGCSGNDKSETNEAGDTNATGDTIKLQVGHVEAEDRSTHRALLEFKEEVESESDGNMVIELHPNAALGGDVQLTESVAMGTLDMALPATSVLVTYAPEFGILDMPYLFLNSENAFEAMDGEIGEYFNDKLEQVGIKNLGYSYNGLRSLTNSVRPVNEPKDLDGLKVRVMESPVFIDFFETLGANATPMSFNELFTGLQQKTVDAQENPPSLIYASKFYEVQEYLSLTEHVNNFLAFIMNQGKFDSLTEEQQDIITNAAKNYVELQREMELEDTGTYTELLETEGGLEVNEVSQENKEKFKEDLEPMYEKYKKDFGEELFETAEKYNN